MSETTLLPCPFCGGEAHMSASSDGYGVECWNRRCIDMQMEEIPTEAEAIAAWNTRAERTCKAENAKLRELVMDMWHELNYTSVRAEDGSNGCLERVLGFDKRMRDLGIEEL